MSDIESRLRAAGRPRAEYSPDVAAIAQRGAARRRNKRLRVGMAAFLTVGAIGLDAGLDDQPTLGQAADVGSVEQGPVLQSAELVDDEEAIDQTPASEEGIVSDTLGGELRVRDRRLTHLRVDGLEVEINLPAHPGAESVMYRAADIAELNGVPHLLINQFASWSIDDEGSGLVGLLNLEVAILAVDLENSQLIEVERRAITSSESPEWFYNGLITTDGANIVVIRELWQGMCLFAEGLALDGTPVDVVAELAYPRPDWLDDISTEEIQAAQAGEAELSGCLSIPDFDRVNESEGLSLQAPVDEFSAFVEIFNRQLSR